MQRRHYFSERQHLLHDTVIANPPKKMYPQETDWTCSVACIRTLLSGFLDSVPSEEALVGAANLQPQPYYSKDIKALGLLNKYDAVYGCDSPADNFDAILDYVEDGYFVMLECMYNYAHWFVLLGYYPLKNGNAEESKLMIYDPYYDEVRLLRVDEFITMWIDGNHETTKVEKDYIAVRGRKN